MAVQLSTNEALYVDQAAVTAFPFTFVSWFKAYSTSNNFPCVYVGDKATDDYACHIEARASNDKLRARIEKNGTASARSAYSADTFTPNQWEHGAGVFDGPNPLRGYLGGVPGDENTGAPGTPSGYDRTALGARLGLTPYYGGYKPLAEAAIWSRALEGWEIAALASGFSPLFFLDGLAAYWPLGGRFGENYRDIVGDRLRWWQARCFMPGRWQARCFTPVP